MQLAPSNGHTPPTIDLQECLDGLYSYALVLSRNQAEAEAFQNLIARRQGQEVAADVIEHALEANRQAELATARRAY